MTDPQAAAQAEAEAASAAGYAAEQGRRDAYERTPGVGADAGAIEPTRQPPVPGVQEYADPGPATYGAFRPAAGGGE